MIGKKIAKILKGKSINRLHYETNITSEPFAFCDFCGFFLLVRLLLNITKLTTEHHNWPKMGQMAKKEPWPKRFAGAKSKSCGGL